MLTAQLKEYHSCFLVYFFFIMLGLLCETLVHSQRCWSTITRWEIHGCSLTSTHLSTYLALCVCKLRQSVKSSFVWSFGVIVSCGAQGYHSSSVINASLSPLVDFGRRSLSSWACASSYHPGGPSTSAPQTNSFSDEALTDLSLAQYPEKKDHISHRISGLFFECILTWASRTQS